jgi:predicted solute-binding protein
MAEILRVGCVKYLNARPLIYGWPGPVCFDHPSSLCQKLARGDLDVALVSSFEFLRNPIYRIADGISICSDGPVYSVVVAHRGDIADVKEISLDPASITSANLLRCLMPELNLNVLFLAEPNSAITNHRGRLLIGDQALHFRQRHEKEFKFWDLGRAWQEFFHLPFVYALWLIRQNVPAAGQISKRLRDLRDENLHRLQQLVESGEEFDTEFCARYYRDNIRFCFGEEEKKGLLKFAKLCALHRLIPMPIPELDLI